MSTKQMILRLALLIVGLTGYALLELQINYLQGRNLELENQIIKLADASIKNSEGINSLAESSTKNSDSIIKIVDAMKGK